jgi:hypothetical protein
MAVIPSCHRIFSAILNATVAEESKVMTWDEVITGAEEGRMHARSALQAMSEVTDKAAEEFSDETLTTTRSTAPRSPRSAPARSVRTAFHGHAAACRRRATVG